MDLVDMLVDALLTDASDGAGEKAERMDGIVDDGVRGITAGCLEEGTIGVEWPAIVVY